LDLQWPNRACQFVELQPAMIEDSLPKILLFGSPKTIDFQVTV
jgi:hypothetical protein